MKQLLAVVTTVATLVAALVAAAAAAGPAAAQPEPDRDPIVFVHGFGENGGRVFFRSAFLADGYEDDDLFAFRYDAGRDDTPSNRTIALRLQRFIEHTVLPETGADHVDLVAHSMGSLSSRWCLRFGSCAELVDDFVSLGGPNHGTTWALGCRLVHRGDRACPEMIRTSSLLQRLNRGDETPGPTSYTTVRSPRDFMVVPSSSVELDGADNHLLRGLTHDELARDHDVYEIVVEAVR